MKRRVLLLVCMFLSLSVVACGVSKMEDDNSESIGNTETATEFGTEVSSEVLFPEDTIETEIIETEIFETNNEESEKIDNTNTELMGQENESVNVPVDTTPKDEFVDKIFIFYSKEDVVFYDEPNVNANVITVIDSYVEFGVQAYNAKTGWYRTRLGVNGVDYIGYCRLDNCLTPEEYRALLNQGVEEKYWCLPCVSKAEEYARNFITRVEVENGPACVHIKGKHNFVSHDLLLRCGNAYDNAEREWGEMHAIYAINNQDGTVCLQSCGSFSMSIVTLEEYNELWSDAKLYESDEAYSESKDQYILDAVLKVLNEG